MRHSFLLYLLIGLFFAPSCGAEFQVNTHTSNEQKNAAIAMDEAGNFVVVWSSYLQDGNSNGIFAQRFDPNCGQLGEEFQVNATSSGNQAEPAVAMDAAAGFVVAWQGPGFIEEDREDIFAQQFDPNGLPIGGEFLVNSYTNDQQLFPCAAMNNDGTFIVVWESSNTPMEGDKAICGQLYDSNGVEFGAEFLVNAESSVCRYPDVMADANGNFAVVWMEDKSSNSIIARLFDPNGTPRTDTFEVSTIGFSSVTRPSIAMGAAGCFVVAWDGDPNLAGLDDIHARLYDANGTALGEQFLVNTTLSSAQQYPQAAMNDDGEFVIVWDCRIDPNSDSERDIFGRRFDSLCEPLGDEFQINTFVADDQRNPAVAIGPDGRFVAVWQSYAQDTSRYGIFARPGPIIGSVDFNADGIVDFYDYCILAEQWHKNENPLTVDLIDDNKIDIPDVAEFCRQWLTNIH
ncbi:MAG TPA: hypothetical protein VMX36_04970 [Sedimentisphaerales bacterium]|nr:hypothetical protein [Sedimentisphaerales bacterium]